MLVPCRSCPACLHNRQKEWAYRLMMEREYSSGYCYFGTLTFDDKLIPSPDFASQLDRKILKDFVKRLRRHLEYHKVTKVLRVFGCGEYGDLGRAHYHLILFDIPLSLKKFLPFFQDCWPFGFVTLSHVTDARLMYVSKYTCKQLFVDDELYKDKEQLPFAYISRGSVRGDWLGHKLLLDKHKVQRLKDEQLFYVRSSNGSVFNLPQAYRKFIFTAAEREARSDFLCFIENPVYTSSYISQLKLKHIYNEQFEKLFWKRLREQRKIKLGCQSVSFLQEHEE